MIPIIEVKHLTKEYRLGHLTSFKETALNSLRRLAFQPIHNKERFKALDDVNFTIEEGEVVGIIGHNGAGKSTLLKHLANISKPTKGKVIVRGSVAPLIEVGAGVNPELTGRENIFLNGAILGIPKKIIKQKLDEIIDFSELEQFIDTPVKRYSSGMTVKLGFSIATSMDADVLIVDEVLAVGDLAFQRKCFDRMEEIIKQQGKTVLLVSHNIRQVERLCTRAIMLEHGKIVKDGNKTEVCELFYQRSNAKIAAQVSEAQVHNTRIRKTGELELEGISLVDKNGNCVEELTMGAPLIIRCHFRATRSIKKPEVIVGLHTTDFFYIASMSNGHMTNRPDMHEGINEVECHIASLSLMPGVYSFRVGVLDHKTSRELFYCEMLKPIVVVPDTTPQSKLPTLGIVYMPAEWQFDNSTAINKSQFEN